MFQAAGPDLTRVIERTGCGLGSADSWGGFRTEFFPTYDLKAVAEQLHIKAQ
jgi:hypothetical protein